MSIDCSSGVSDWSKRAMRSSENSKSVLVGRVAIVSASNPIAVSSERVTSLRCATKGAVFISIALLEIRNSSGGTFSTTTLPLVVFLLTLTLWLRIMTGIPSMPMPATSSVVSCSTTSLVPSDINKTSSSSVRF